MEGAVLIESCGACRGVWLDSGSARRVAEALPPGVPSLEEEGARHAFAKPAKEAVIVCPVCSQTMVRTAVAGAGIELDSCAEHGTWYDKSELQQVAAALALARSPRITMSESTAGPQPDAAPVHPHGRAAPLPEDTGSATPDREDPAGQGTERSPGIALGEQAGSGSRVVQALCAGAKSLEIPMANERRIDEVDVVFAGLVVLRELLSD